MSAKVMVPLLIVYMKIAELIPFARNARTHSKWQIKQIAESIRVFGFTNPVLIDRINRIVAGHGRMEAARLLGMTEVPTIRLEDLSEDQIRAYVIADNQIATTSKWDRSILAIELQHLSTLDCIDFDVTVTGFEIAEIDQLLVQEVGTSPAEEPPPEPMIDRPPVTEPGDLWMLGVNRVFCGDSLLDASYRCVLGRRKASMTISDPPYNVAIHGHATGNGSIHHREFAMGCGEMNKEEYPHFLGQIQGQLSSYSAPGSLHFLFIDWRHVDDMISTGKQTYGEFINLCVWDKGHGAMGSLYRSQHELVCVFRNGKGPRRNNIQLGKFGRNRTNVWKYPGVQTFSKQGDEGNLLALHPTVKPIAMIADAILDCTSRGEIVLDAFLGSGTTLMAAQRVGRVCCAIEIDPLYVDVAIRRWQNHTGEDAVHANSKKTFNEIAELKAVKHA